MKHFKLMIIAAVSATVLSLAPVQAAQAADPVKACSKSLLKIWTVSLKQINKAIKKGCKGLSPAEIENKGLFKINRAIARANKVNATLDCVSNGDPDLSGFYPIPPLAPGDNVIDGSLAGYAAFGAKACDGVVTP